MQTQPLSPYAENPASLEQQGTEESPRKKSVMGKVKDKARKLKTKIQKPKSPGAADNNDESGSEDESGSDPQQQVGDQPGEETEVVSKPGLHGEATEVIPDPHVSDAPFGTAGVEQGIGQMSLEDKPDIGKVQEEVPTAAGHASTGVTSSFGDSPYASEQSRDIPAEEGKNAEGKDLLVTPTPTDSQETTDMDYEKTPEVSKTNDTAEEGQQEKPLSERVPTDVGATAAASAGVLGVQSVSDDGANRDANTIGEREGMLEQAKESVLGSATEQAEGEELTQAGESKPTITERISETATGEGETTGIDATDPANKSVLQKIQERASGVAGVVTNKLGYGGKPLEGAGEPVAETPTAEGEQKTYLQKMQESAVGAKDTVASKLGYGERDLPASTEGAYSDEQNVPDSTGTRFHPGEEDRALSKLITEKMSVGATTVKDTLLRPFGGSKSGPATPTTTPAPSSAQVVADDPGHTTVTGTNGMGAPNAAAGEEKPGIMGKVTGAVSSLLSPSGTGQKTIDEHASEAKEDSQSTGV